ncbi:MAG: hypothetical protein OEX22_10010, partial [Cyclobacteriaceae bacterium]|nr:hypothetical protein [Cyclobacteriaceae bacterium]
NIKGNRKKVRIPANDGSDFKGRFTTFELSPGYLAEGATTHKGNTKSKTNYKHNPKSHEDALKGIAPKNSAYKAMAFQGNFKIKKTYKKGMHPSAKYTTYHKPLNSLKEKEKTIKFKIWWAKLIKRNENQPPSVKEKIRKPRYSESAKDIWYE